MLASELCSPTEMTRRRLADYLEQYSSVLRQAYGDPEDEKVQKALDDDRWRYEALPNMLKERQQKDQGSFLELKDLERLVQWKIKHGRNRPFLIGMVRKNDPSSVKDVTRATFAELPNRPSMADILEALKNLNKLKGVGAATGSLILSAYNPESIPFFEDELYTWLCRTTEMKQGLEVKLKYNLKEFEELLNALDRLKRRLQKEPGDCVPVWMFEKAAFVIGQRIAEPDHQEPAEAKHEPKDEKKNKKRPAEKLDRREDPTATKRRTRKK